MSKKIKRWVFQSTHPWWVRKGIHGDLLIDSVSIHTPVMGANRGRNRTWCYQCFNPHTRDGCEKGRRLFDQVSNVSIHTPVMGANASHQWRSSECNVSIHTPVMGAKPIRILISYIQSFNPHTRDGCEQNNVNISSVFRFQSTHPWWVRI